MVHLICMEGIIGAGKSTILEKLKQGFQNNKNIHFLPEPIESWQKLKLTHTANADKSCNLLEQFYQDPQKWGFKFEVCSFV